jgi:hypothetical protein
MDMWVLAASINFTLPFRCSFKSNVVTPLPALSATMMLLFVNGVML